MSDQEQARHTEVWMYVGGRQGTSGLVHAWQDEDGKERYYKGNLASGARVGSRYRITLDDQERVHTGGASAPQFIDRLEMDDERVLQWQLEVTAARAWASMQSRARKANAKDPIRELLEPVRSAYLKSHGVARSAILARVIDAVVRP